MTFDITLLRWVALALVLAVPALILLKLGPGSKRPKEPDAPITVALAGAVIVFAILFGLTIAQEKTTLNAASSVASTEATSVGELYWYAHSLSEPEHSKLQSELRTYTTVVTTKEWPLLGKHQSSPAASAAVRAIRFDILSFQPRTPTEIAVYPKMLSEVGNLFQARRSRIDIAQYAEVTPELLVIIVIGALINLALLSLVGTVHKRKELAFFTLFGTFLFVALLLVVDLNNPFKGSFEVHPTAFNILYTGTFKNVS